MAASDRQVAGTHYKTMGVQVWDVVDTWPPEQQIGYYRGGALKYLMRMGTKDAAIQESEKGLHYLEKLVECLKKLSVQEKLVMRNPARTLEEAYEQQYRQEREK